VDAQSAAALRQLLDGQPIASLGTLHHGEPYVSMVPYSLLPDASALVVHVSQLSPHTRDMLASPSVSLLVIAAPAPDVTPQARARVTIQGHATQLTATSPDYAPTKSSYLSRFPDSAMMFDLPDFSLFVIRPRSIRLIAGFAQAMTITPDAFAEACRR
jgi:putative heme iron utilization protein